MRLWKPVDGSKQGGYIQDNTTDFTPPFGEWRLATTAERIWWEINHSRFGFLDLAVMVVIAEFLRNLLGVRP